MHIKLFIATLSIILCPLVFAQSSLSNWILTLPSPWKLLLILCFKITGCDKCLVVSDELVLPTGGCAAPGLGCSWRVVADNSERILFISATTYSGTLDDNGEVFVSFLISCLIKFSAFKLGYTIDGFVYRRFTTTLLEMTPLKSWMNWESTL